ncbi:cytochrome c3 family protein [Bacteroidota bacterium]
MKFKFPKSYYNTVSFIGTILAVISLAIIAFLFVLSFFFQEGSNYLGLFMFIIMPIILIIGLLLIPLGMWRANRNAKRDDVVPGKRWMIIDMNENRQRNAVFIFIAGTVIFLFLTGIGSYKAYHYTESVQFCGTLCHTVMEPEFVTYQNSPHARVTCTECHVGPGADWFVKSKLSGLYQVYAVIFNKYPRPIPTPISSLRPARETCEQCHWPEKFYSHKLEYEKHYLADSVNTEWNISLRMKLSSYHSSGGIQEGIHWHINPDVKIEYIAPTEDREYIPWVRYTNLATGDTFEYIDTYDPLDEETLSTYTPRTMDCMDCHNRPSHQYLTPSEFVDLQIAAGTISSDLPFFKKTVMEIFNNIYGDIDTALYYIEKNVMDFYQENYPLLHSEKQSDIMQAIKKVQGEYRKNYFHHMSANWDVYPNHIGHMEYNGCFRCHNDTHESKEGRIISKDCNECHTILQQGTLESMEVAPFNEYLEFRHPVDVEDAWREYLCTDCHRYLYI